MALAGRYYSTPRRLVSVTLQRGHGMVGVQGGCRVTQRGPACQAQTQDNVDSP